jgi:hypothetical protein
MVNIYEYFHNMFLPLTRQVISSFFFFAEALHPSTYSVVLLVCAFPFFNFGYLLHR